MVKAIFFDARERVPWEKSEVYVLRENRRGGEAEKRTEFRMLWTPSEMWFRFDCEDDAAVATRTRFNDDLYEEDVAEVFITPGDLAKYHEFEVAPNANGMHILIKNPGKGFFFGHKRRRDEYFRRVTKEGENWVAEFAVPFRLFNRRPGAGERWRMNALRCDLRPDGKTQEIYALSPTHWSTFHRPKRFVPVTFVKTEKDK